MRGGAIQAFTEDRPPRAQTCAFSGYTRRGCEAIRITEKGIIDHNWYWGKWHR